MKLFKPKVVIFDIDDTLYSYLDCHNFALNKVIGKLKNEFGLSEIEFKKQYNSANKLVKSQLNETASAHNKFLYFKIILENLEFSPYINIALELDNLYWETFLDHIKPFNNLINFLEQLRIMSINVGLISNFQAVYQFRKVINLSINDYVDCLVSSEEVGINKPNEVIFKKIMNIMNFKENESWMIGNSVSQDIIPSKKIMYSKTFLIETTDRFDNKNKFIDFAFKDYKFMLDKISKYK